MRALACISLIFSFLAVLLKGQRSDLFISEYGEGSGYNKYVEIFNGTGSSLDLSKYKIWKITNGGSWPEKELDLSGTLAHGDVYVVAHSSANPTVLNKSDVTWGSANWNGDDAVGLGKDISGIWTLIDAVGTDGSDPGTGWDVAGIANATANHTLVRKQSVTVGNTDWPSSSGIDSEDSEWIVHDEDTFEYLGSHTISSGGTSRTSVRFSSSSASVSEGAGTYIITVSISNEDASNETSVDVVLTTKGTGTNGADISPYSTQRTTFPPVAPLIKPWKSPLRMIPISKVMKPLSLNFRM